MKLRTTVVAIAAGAALALSSMTPAAAVAPVATAFQLSTPEVLTLPADDGFRDDTQVTVRADGPATFSAAITDGDDTPLGELTCTSNELDATNAFMTSCDVPIGTLSAGTYQIAVASVDLEQPIQATVPVVVGTGNASSVRLVVDQRSVFPSSGDSHARTHVSVSATDETGVALPFGGTVRAALGSKHTSVNVSSPTGKAAGAYLYFDGFKTGTASASATVAGPNGAFHTGASVSITLKPTSLSAIKLSATTWTVYPSHDGFRDTTRFTLAMTTSTGSAIPVTGTVTIKRGTRSIVSWKLSSKRSWSAAWNGKDHGKLVPGKYTVTVSAHGPQGSTKTWRKTINVSQKRLKRVTTSKWINGESLRVQYVDYSISELGQCYSYTWDTALHCDGYSAYYDDTWSLFAQGTVGIPSAAAHASSLGTVRVRITADTSEIDGIDRGVLWGYGPSGTEKVGYLSTGTRNLGWASVPSGSKNVKVVFGLTEYMSFVIDRFKIEYSYNVLTK